MNKRSLAIYLIGWAVTGFTFAGTVAVLGQAGLLPGLILGIIVGYCTADYADLIGQVEALQLLLERQDITSESE